MDFNKNARLYLAELIGTFALTFTDAVDRSRLERAGLVPAAGEDHGRA